MSLSPVSVLLSGTLVLTISCSSRFATAAAADFETDIRPLLIAECQKCHGAKKQESGFRVDSREAVMRGGDSGPAVVPGDVSKGTLLAAVHHRGDIAMPPNGKLSAGQIQLIEQWIADGAPWPDESETAATRTGLITDADRQHWAFQSVSTVDAPTVRNSGWPRNTIDDFILAQLEKKNLRPQKDADRRTLIRRVTLDLTGLPPTPDEIEQFLADDSPDAFADVIDRLLNSPHYGERWGRHWLDVARYADTAGDGADYPVREAYKYRDWVINAFNADMPFEQFVKEQIAGDILAAEGPEELYADRVIATGFLAIGKRYGYNPGPGFQHLDFADAIESIGRSLLGLSLGCARCHDHKYEPVTMADYYGLYGILESTTWAFPGGEEQQRPSQFPKLIPPDEAERKDRTRAAELAALDEELSSLRLERDRLNGSSRAGGPDLDFEQQELNKPLTGNWLSQGPVLVSADSQSPFANVHSPGGRGVRILSGTPGDGIRYVFTHPRRASPGKTLYFSTDLRPLEDSETTGSRRLYLGRGVVASQALECSVTKTEFAVRNGDQWEIVCRLNPGEWVNLSLQIDTETRTWGGTIGRPGALTRFADKALHSAWDGILDTFICDGHGHLPGPPTVYDFDNIGLLEEPFPTLDSTLPPFTPPADLLVQQSQLEQRIAQREKERAELVSRELYNVAYGVSEGVPKNSRVQKRGEPEKPGEEVPRRFLEILGGDRLVNPDGSGRHELAEWISRPSNPLTYRVFVNRVWGWHFGRGLVSTPSDFGTRGEPPTHPELLDWLTRQFLESGGSLKSLHRLILLSRTWQQSSLDDEANLQTDPGNLYLWKHTRRPLDAESVRDSMLAVSGLLDRSRPGPHPFPPVESWRFTIHNPFHAVYDSRHRSIFLMQQRNRRHPFLALFDGADPNLSTANRMPTITPSQSLYLMNSSFVHEQSHAFAERLLHLDGDTGSRITAAFEMTAGRPPTRTEAAESEQFVAAYLSGSENTRAAWAALGRVLMTSNNFLYVD